MKFKLLLILIIAIHIILSCTPNYPPVNNESEVIELANTQFTMKEVPGAGIYSMVIGLNKKHNEEIKPFWLAETELTSEVWYEVYTWATGDLDMNGIINAYEIGGKYKFQNPGAYGRDHGKTGNRNGQVPISGINWRDAMVFCNAITEYYNETNNIKEQLQTVYNYKNEPIRNSTDDNAEICDYVEQPLNADGFRLPTKMEWRCAASYVDGSVWNKGKHASGDLTGRSGRYKQKSEFGIGLLANIFNLISGNFEEVFKEVFKCI